MLISFRPACMVLAFLWGKDKSCMCTSTGVDAFDDGVDMFARGMIYDFLALSVLEAGPNRVP